MKKAEITLEQAREYYGKNMVADMVLETMFSKRELEGKSELTKKWEELEIINGFVVDTDARIFREDTLNALPHNKNIFSTESKAKAALAFAMLSQIAKECNDRAGWVADWKDDEQIKYVINRIEDELSVDSFGSTFHHITFHSKEAAEESLVKHEQLWKDYWELC